MIFLVCCGLTDEEGPATAWEYDMVGFTFWLIGLVCDGEGGNFLLLRSLQLYIKLIKMYNKLPGRVKSSENFKSDLKKLLHEKNYYSFDQFFNDVL